MLAYPHGTVQLPTLNISLIRSIRNLFPSLGSSPHPQLAPEKPKFTHVGRLTHFAWLLRRVTFTFPSTRFKYKLEDKSQEQIQISFI